MEGFRWLCEESELEAQDALDSYESCTFSDHETDQLLLNYTCAFPFQKWISSVGSARLLLGRDSYLMKQENILEEGFTAGA